MVNQHEGYGQPCYYCGQVRGRIAELKGEVDRLMMERTDLWDDVAIQRTRAEGRGGVAMDHLVKQLRAFCVGYPGTNIPWPLHVLHEAADRIAELEAEVERQRTFLQIAQGDIAIHQARAADFEGCLAMLREPSEELVRAICENVAARLPYSQEPALFQYNVRAVLSALSAEMEKR